MLIIIIGINSGRIFFFLDQKYNVSIKLDCKKNEKVGPKVLNDVGFTQEQATRVRLFKSKGCKKCENRGYKGRQAIYEV